MKKHNPKKKAVVLLSGGMDSATCLFLARKEGYDCTCLSFDYGQRNKKEIAAARTLARLARAQWRKVRVDFPREKSALVDKKVALPKKRDIESIGRDIPVTYVPSRNIIFLSLAASYAETTGAEAVFIGAHAQDFSGYPDCRKEFFEKFSAMLAAGTKTGVEGKPIKVIAPLLTMTKKEIVLLGASLDVPYQRTWSCYAGGKKPCGVCDACILREKGFIEAGL
jgi:7-cyano-7-deazaguanine synthase